MLMKLSMNKSPQESPPENATGQGSAKLNWGQVLGLEVVQVQPDQVILQWQVEARHLQPWGVVHGGVHASVVETACSLGAQSTMPRGKHVVGVENHTSFVRAVGKGLLRATAKPLHAGRQAQLWECVIVDERDRLIATGRLRLLCVDDASAAASGGVSAPTGDGP